MKIIKTIFNKVCLLAPEIFSDERGFFYESYNSETFNIYNHQHLRWGSYFLYALVNFFLEINYLYIVIISFIFVSSIILII